MDMGRVIAHIDMDCFFCACEMKRKPELKGKPVIVGGIGHKGVVSAASYKARDHGVFSATPIALARKRCPDGIFLPVDGKLYREESKRVMSILAKFSDTIRQMSIDEAYLDVTELFSRFETKEAMADTMKRTIEIETGLTCSIGIAASTIVAKIASDHKKPGGITIVEDTKEFLREMPISKIPGIGKVSEEAYKDRDLHYIGDFLEKSNAELYEEFGNNGLFYKRLAQGDYTNSIEHSGPRKSVSRESTLENNTTNIIELEDKIIELCSDVYEDLEDGFFKTVSIKIKYSDFSTITRDKSLKTPSNDLEAIKRNSLDLFRRTITSRTGVRLLGVKLGNIEEKGQRTLRT
ncbi:MAG: DNA polymerase IV [Candidatus Woesearchaeota archaeon]